MDFNQEEKEVSGLNVEESLEGLRKYRGPLLH